MHPIRQINRRETLAVGAAGPCLDLEVVALRAEPVRLVQGDRIGDARQSQPLRIVDHVAGAAHGVVLGRVDGLDVLVHLSLIHI